ncbi:MAG: hypothetical protein HON32_07055 [Francisellaceae bacterium]|nr:hypothetical protein [Francisellaceae bacterium]
MSGHFSTIIATVAAILSSILSSVLLGNSLIILSVTGLAYDSWNVISFRSHNTFSAIPGVAPSPSNYKII